MRRIAVLADIHGNMPALEAVIAHIAASGVDEVVVAGDLVGRGPQGAQVVERVRELGWASVRGNHEDYMVNFARELVPADWLTTEYWAASRWMAQGLSAEQIDYIAGLPDELAAASTKLLRIVHGTPRSNNEGIGAWTDRALLEEFMREQAPVPTLVCAHTHRPYIARVGGGQVVNIGSVGMPFNGDWRAQYAIFTCDEERGEVEVSLQQVGYSREELFEIYNRSGFLGDCGFTSYFLKKELEHARPFLVPYIRWSEYVSRDACDKETIKNFLDIYDPQMPTEEFMRRLMAGEPTR
jgi:predicted phosphodiesterase